jgi:ferredoxin-NADP reductase
MTTVQDQATDLPLTVVSKIRLSTDVVGITLAGAGAEPLLPWEAGAHIDVQCGDLRRQYSLCGDPDDRQRYQIAVLREPDGRGGSTYLHDTLEPSDILWVSRPRNTFALESASRYVFIAGGIGITPILPMLAEAERRGADWMLHYGGRTRAGMAFVAELGRHGNRVRIYPQEEVGRIPLADALGKPDRDTKIYCCGPMPLLDAVAGVSEHWPDGSLHVERFSRVALDTDTERGFDVRLASSGGTYHVPRDRTILEVLTDAGVDVVSSCEVGTCGTCEATVLEGVPDHRDSVLTPQERKEGQYMMLCVSRCLSDTLALDL